MELRIIKNKEEFIDFKPEWESLQQRAVGITFYSTYEFLHQWWKSFGVDGINSLLIVGVYEKSKLIGIAPLMIEKRKLLFVSYNVIKFIGRSDFHNFIIDKDSKNQSVIKKIFDAIGKKKGWHRLELSHISQNSTLSNFLLKSDIYNKSFEFLGENPIIDFSKHDDFALFKKTFFKKNINYYRNKLKKDFNATLEVVYGNKNDLLSKISKVHISRNSDSNERRSLFEDSKVFANISKLYEEENNTITFLLKTQEGDIISYATCYLFNSIVHNWNTSFKLAYRDYSAGDLIYFEMIKYLFENKETLKKLDLGAGRYPWKFRMTNSFIATHKLNYNSRNSKKFYALAFYDKLFKIGKIIFNKM